MCHTTWLPTLSREWQVETILRDSIFNDICSLLIFVLWNIVKPCLYVHFAYLLEECQNLQNAFLILSESKLNADNFHTLWLRVPFLEGENSIQIIFEYFESQLILQKFIFKMSFFNCNYRKYVINVLQFYSWTGYYRTQILVRFHFH